LCGHVIRPRDLVLVARLLVCPHISSLPPTKGEREEDINNQHRIRICGNKGNQVIKGISEQADKVNKLGESQRERHRILTPQNQASISS
jgi:hypothetical protein